MRRRPVFHILLSAAVLMPLLACEAKKSSSPLSPSVAGPIAGVEITAPRLLEPSEGIKLKESQQPITLLVENSSTNGVRPVAYTFEVSRDTTFDVKLYARSGVTPGPDGRTRVTVDRLDSGRSYFWRVRAEDGANSSVYSTSRFELLPKPQLDPPAQHAPINNEQTSSRRPALVVGSSARNAAVGNVVYHFEIAADVAFSARAAAGERSEAGNTTSYSPDGDLTPSTTYYWRVRATDGEFTGGWSPTQSFRTPAAPGPAPGPGPGPSPTPGNGGSCASNNGDFIARCTMGKYPQHLAGGVSHNQRVSNMEFLRDRMIEAGICGGMDLAWNKKRGNGPHSIDALAWRVNGRDEVVDIGLAYDDTSIPLQLTWGIVGGPPGYDPYPRPSCR